MFDATAADTDRSPFGEGMPTSCPTLLEPDVGSLFRQAMRRHAAGVCLISAGENEALNGMAVTSATSFSMAPPSVLVCINETASLAPKLVYGACFGLTVLGRDHEEVVAAFSRKPSGRARFSDPNWRFAEDDAPWLEGAPANLSCVVERRLTYGSHTAIIGRVTGVRLGPDAPSLVFRNGVYA